MTLCPVRQYLGCMEVDDACRYLALTVLLLLMPKRQPVAQETSAVHAYVKCPPVAQFGCAEVDDDLVRRIERLTGEPAHPFLKRKVFYAHRDLTPLLDAYEKGEPFYLYTGRVRCVTRCHMIVHRPDTALRHIIFGAWVLRRKSRCVKDWARVKRGTFHLSPSWVRPARPALRLAPPISLAFLPPKLLVTAEVPQPCAGCLPPF